MAEDALDFDANRQALARELHRVRRWLARFRAAILFAFLAFLVLAGAPALRVWIEIFGLAEWAVAAIFIAVLYSAGSLLDLPFAYLGGYRLERASGLSTQSLASWLRDRAKSSALGFAAIVAAGEVVLWLLRAVPEWWWLIAWALGLLVSLVISYLVPIVLVPLFYRFRPLADPGLRKRFEDLAARAGVSVIGVFELVSSVKSRRSNAGVVGFRGTRRILVTDTMLQDFTPDELETVLAHELGHQRFRDPILGFAVNAMTSLFVLAVAAYLYGALYGRFDLRALDDVAGLPLLAGLGTLISIPLGPLELWWSRWRERRSDRFALELSGNARAFASAMVKLHDKNLGVAYPSRLDLWLHYTHPPGGERVALARSLESLP